MKCKERIRFFLYNQFIRPVLTGLYGSVTQASSMADMVTAGILLFGICSCIYEWIDKAAM